MRAITTEQFRQMMKEHRGAQFLCVESVTDSRARKTGNPYGTILKKSRAVCMTGASYEKGVIRQGEREGVEGIDQFQAEPLPWGEWDVPNKIVSHNGKLYLRTQTTQGMRRKRPAIVHYVDKSGNPLSAEIVRPFLPEKKGSAKQESWGVEGEVQVRCIALDNIQRIRMNGRTWVIAD